MTQQREIKIAVMDRGHVWVGWVELHPTLAHHWLIKGRCVRQWGTTEGLAQLAGGPVKGKTKLDAPGEIELPFRGLLYFLKVEQKAWKNELS